MGKKNMVQFQAGLSLPAFLAHTVVRNNAGRR
jgi:hypothetical protein